MDFRNEAANAKHCVANFSKMKHTSLVVPDVLWSQERILVMEYIEGGRVDDLEYLRRHRIDRSERFGPITSTFYENNDCYMFTRPSFLRDFKHLFSNALHRWLLSW